MEPANQPPVKKDGAPQVAYEFLPDADEIERRPLPREARITLHVLFVTVLLFVLWASFSEVDQIVVARGKLVTPLPNIVVQPLETSIIESIDVRVGQIVKKGERLATLDPTFTEADVSLLQARLGSLDTQTRRLEAELSGGSLRSHNANEDSKLQAQLAAERLANYKAQLRKLDENIAQVRAAQESNRNDQELLQARVKNLREIEAMQEKLVDQKAAPPLRLLEEREKRLSVERELQLAKNHAEELARQLAALQAERAAFEKSWRQRTMEDLLNTTRDRQALSEQLLKADKRHRMVELVAPADAVVLEMAKLSQGSIARATEPMFTLVPLSSSLEAEVQIDAADVGYVKKGDKVKLKFDAFPFQKHGLIEGKLRTLSEDAFQRETALGTAAYYLGRVDYGDQQLEKMPPSGRLLPGMTLTAEIVVGKRTVMSYLLWPLTKTMDEAIREP